MSRKPDLRQTRLPKSLRRAYQGLFDALEVPGVVQETDLARMKEQQFDLFADRTSCHAWWPNQYGLPLSAIAYALLEAIRRVALAGIELAYAGTIRLKLLKIGTGVFGQRLLLFGSCPHQALFHAAAARLQPG